MNFEITADQRENIITTMNTLRYLDEGQFEMGVFLTSRSDSGPTVECNSLGCIAGWATVACLGFDKAVSISEYEAEAHKLLGIPTNMFFEGCWPKEMRNQLKDVPEEAYEDVSKKLVLDYLQKVLDGIAPDPVDDLDD